MDQSHQAGGAALLSTQSPPKPASPALLFERLRPHQREPFQHLHELLRAGRNCVDASDCGVGKTYVACAVAAALKLPTLVVAPKIAETQWKTAAAHFNDSISFVGYELLRTGRTPYGTWQRMPTPEELQRKFFVCQCCQLQVDLDKYQSCYTHPLGIHCIATKKTAHRYGRFSFAPEIKFLVFDEAHRCNGLDSLNADMLIAARNQRIPALGLSATLGSSPLHFRALGYLLGLHNLNTDLVIGQPAPKVFPSFRRWASKYGVRKDPAFHGLKWFASESAQAEAMTEIRQEIIPARGVRVSVNDIPDFPKVDISAELYDLDEAGRIDQIYAEMADSLQRLANRTQRDVAPDSAITMMLRAHQKVELLKVPLAVELAQSYMDQGISIGIFVNFRQTLLELGDRLDTSCVIDGSLTGLKMRQRNIDAFQANRSKIILVNNAAGGIVLSLHDLHGGHPRGGLVMPGYSAQALKQVFGRFPRDGGKSRSFYKVLLAAKTGDVKIHRVLRAKLNNLDALNDADLLPENLKLN